MRTTDSLYSRHVPRQKPPRAVDAALKLLKAEQRPPTAGDAPRRPSAFSGKPPPHIAGQLELLAEPAEGGTS